jgi:hypothetical protein
MDFLATDEQRDDHVRVHHYVAQWQNRQALDGDGLGSRGGFSHAAGPQRAEPLQMQRDGLYLVKV